MVNTLEAILDLVVFLLSDREYCADTKKIVAILKPEEISFDLENRTGKVLVRDNKEYLLTNVKKFLKLKEEKFSNSTRVILLESDGLKILFYVDQVLEIISIHTGSALIVQNEPLEDEFIEMVIEYEHRRFELPDYHKMALITKQEE